MITQVCSELNVTPNDFLKTAVKNEIKKYKKAKEKENRATGKTRREILELASDHPVFDENSPLENKPDEPQAKKSRKSGTAGGYKRFEDLKNDMKAKRTDNILAAIHAFVTKENTLRSSGDHQPFTARKLLGYLLYRIEYCTDKQMAEFGHKLFKNEPVNTNQRFD